MYAVKVNNLTKSFDGFIAVNNIDLEIEQGEIFGLLGPNGAGKTTTIRMLCGILEPTSGSGIVGGFDITREAEKIKEVIGYMSQKFSLYEDLTVEENIDFYGGIYRLARQELSERKKWVIEMASLLGREKTITKELAGGWKQRLALGCAILHRPRILFLDEPTAGVDPISRRKFWDLIYDLSSEGTTVFVTTHYMEEAERCNKLALMYEGKLVACNTPAELKAKFLTGNLLEIECYPFVKAVELLRTVKQVIKATLLGSLVHVIVKDVQAALPIIENALKQTGIIVKRIEKITPKIDDVFVSLIEREEIKLT